MCECVCVCMCVSVCVREREKESLCVSVCVCGGEKEKGRKESMGERDVATETGVGRGDLSASSKHRTAGHTLMLVMDSQTIVCLSILCLLCTFLRVGRQGSFPTEHLDRRFSILVFHVVEWYSVSLDI